ncbi:unnamed protein product, partial [Ectocarpus sp. 4 AP-2014]
MCRFPGEQGRHIPLNLSVASSSPFYECTLLLSILLESDPCFFVFASWSPFFRMHAPFLYRGGIRCYILFVASCSPSRFPECIIPSPIVLESYRKFVCSAIFSFFPNACSFLVSWWNQIRG